MKATIEYANKKGQIIKKQGHIEVDYFYAEGSGKEEKIRFLLADGTSDPLPWLSDCGLGNWYNGIERDSACNGKSRIAVKIKLSLL